MERITADIDTKSKLILFWNIFKGLKKIEKIKKIEICPSHSKGYHLTFWTSQKYSLKKVFELRKAISDDKNRIEMDKRRKFGRQTFFYKKIKK